MSLEKILVLDDEVIIRNVLGEILSRKHCTVSAASCLAEAENLVAHESFDLMFVDVRLPDGDGHQFLERVSLLPERPPVVIITGYGTIESAVACMRAGAFELSTRTDIPPRVAISEYVDVAKAFFSGPEPGLVNAVLDRIARVVRSGEIGGDTVGK